MQSCAEWIHNNIENTLNISDTELNAAGRKPLDSVYTHLDKVKYLVIHHSATGSGCARVFRALHRRINGWADIGYHYIIGNGTLSGDGEIEPGRPVWAAGAHSRGHNNESIGICLVGNLNETFPSAKQMEALTELLIDLMADHALSSSAILLHKDVPGCRTECPGKNLTLKEILDQLQ